MSSVIQQLQEIIYKHFNDEQSVQDTQNRLVRLIL